jgi:hypothetical protein
MPADVLACSCPATSVEARADRPVRHRTEKSASRAGAETERRQCARSPSRPVSLSVTAWRGADMMGSRTLLRPGDRKRTGELRRDVPGPDRLPKPGSLDDARLAPFRLPRITPGLQASGRQPAIQETSLSSCSIGASRPGLPAHPCAVTHHQPSREGRRTACGMHDGRGYQRHGNPGRPCRRQKSAFLADRECAWFCKLVDLANRIKSGFAQTSYSGARSY